MQYQRWTGLSCPGGATSQCHIVPIGTSIMMDNKDLVLLRLNEEAGVGYHQVAFKIEVPDKKADETDDYQQGNR